jgi:hypothetical protein
MAGYLRNLLVGEGNIDPAIASGHHVCYIIKGHTRLAQRILHNLIGKSAVLSASGTDDLGDDLFIHDHHLGHGGANINPGKVHLKYPSSHIIAKAEGMRPGYDF